MKCRNAHMRWPVAAPVMAAVALMMFAGWLLPHDEAVKTTVALTVAYAIPFMLYRRSGHACQAGHLVLLAAWLALDAVAVPFLHQCTVAGGASFAMPRLSGDAANYYDWALAHYDGSAIEPKMTFWGYSVIIMAVWRLLGVSVIWPVALNVMVTLVTIVLTGSLAVRLTGGLQKPIGTVAMAMIAVQGYFMSQGAQMLKEPWVYLAITLIAYSLVPSPELSGGKRRKGNHACQVLIYTVGCFVLAAVRAKYVNFMFVGIAMMAIAGRMRQWKYYVSLMVITVMCWCLGMAMTDHYTFIQQVNNVTGEGGMGGIFAPEGVYQSLLGDYFHYPFWKKITRLPLVCGAQWMIPFPWLPPGEPAAWLNIAPRLRVGWYLLSGAVVYFYLFCSWRHGRQWAAWAWLPMLCFIGIAYMTSGTVSRYVLPFEPWWMSMAATTVISYAKRCLFRLFLLVYLVVIAVILMASAYLVYAA